MDRKSYMREVYSKHYITTREKIYGFLEYDKNLCSYLCRHVPIGSKLLEVAIGTGYPIAQFLQKRGYSIYGIDIAARLIEKCKKLYPEINCKVGDAERLEYPNNYFGASYCFHSTWYFPDLNKAIDEMIRVTRPSGLIMFDIQNRNNQDINNGYQRRLAETKGMGKIKRYVKNIAAVILRRGTPNWHFVVYEVPVYPESIYEHLKGKQISNFKVLIVKENEVIEVGNELGSIGPFSRLVFAIEK